MSFADFVQANALTLIKPTNAEKNKGGRPRSKFQKDKKAGRINIAADFETTTTEDDCRVWSWGYVNVDEPDYDNVVWGTNLDDFMRILSAQNSICYFHNLKFDGHFILSWLFRHGYTHVENNVIPIGGEFQSVISVAGKFYSITIRWRNGYSTELRDSLKKLPMTIREIAKAFHLPTTKGDIDYDAPRPIGYQLTEEEIDYLKRDVSILGQALKMTLAEGMNGLTVAGDALREYKAVTGMNMFQHYFPVLHENIDDEIRQSYRGGFTYADPRFKDRINGSGIVFDVNSLYPFVMKTCLLPYGEPKFLDDMLDIEDHDNDPEYPLWIRHLMITAKIKPNHIPCIQIKRSNMFIETEYLTEIIEPTEITITSVDWELFNEHYDINIHMYDSGWAFKGAVGMFDTYINKWSEIKAQSVGGRREIAKLFMNSLYGKFASNPNVTAKIPTFVDDIVKLVRGPDETRPSIYTAVGSFITANARSITIRAAQKHYDVFAYADTDSLHLLTDEIPTDLEVHPTKLGAWKFEYAFTLSYYIRAKAYMEMKYEDNFHKEDCPIDCEIQHNFVNRIAGLPTSISSTLTFKDLVDEKEIQGKLRPKVVPGGIILDPTPFRLNLH